MAQVTSSRDPEIHLKRTPAGRLWLDLRSVEGRAPTTRAVDPASLVDEHGWSPLELADAAGYSVTAQDIIAEALGLLPTREVSSGGLGYGAAGRGLITGKESKPLYHPLHARGSMTSHGMYEEMWRSEVQIQRPWVDLLDALIGGDWYVDPAPGSGALGEEQAQWLEAALMNIQGGWDAFLTGACYSLIAGFALWETVYDPDTLAIDKLAFRHPRQVKEWLVDRDETRLVGVRVGSPQRPDVMLPAHHVLLLSHNSFGLDFEGNSPLRPIAKYAAAKEVLDRLQMLGFEKYATLILTVSSDPAKAASDSDEIVDVLTDMSGEDLVVVTLPDGRTLDVVSPAGQMPDFSPAKEYCDLQIALALRGEGGSLGQSGTGSYALAEVVDGKRLGAVPSYARRICAAINGSRGVPWTGIVRKMVDARWGEPSDGVYPQLRYAMDRRARSTTWVADVAAARQGQLIGEWTRADEVAMREYLGLEV